MTRTTRHFITTALLIFCLFPMTAMAQNEQEAPSTTMTREAAEAKFLREFLWTQNFGVLGVDQYG